jgi:hypothetical protein
VTPTSGDYSEGAVLADVAPGQKVTIPLTMRVPSPAHILITILSLLIGPSSVGTSPFPALRNVPLDRGSPVNGLRMRATFTIDAPGRYAVLAYAISTSPCPARETGPITSAQPIGYVVVR